MYCTKDCGAVSCSSLGINGSRPAKSRLVYNEATADTVLKILTRLANFWGLDTYPWSPGSHKEQRALFKSGRGVSHWHEVRWMPVLKDGWRRPTFREMLEIYEIKRELK